MSKKFKDLKKDGKVTINAPKVKERKKFAPATKVEKPKKGKGSYERKKTAEEDEEKKACWKGYKKQGMKKKGDKKVNNCVKESSEIYKFVGCILGEDHAAAQKHLTNIINNKLEKLISLEIEKPLF
jgi:stalled ribosome alternative rescue factor ArfA